MVEETPTITPPVGPIYRDASSRWPASLTGLTAILYSLIVFATAWRHEPWADEAQAWLLARDATFLELWTKLLHYEGSPGLWHTLLMALNHLGLPYRSEGIASGFLGLVAAGLIFWRAPFPLAVRLLLPFSYFLAFQYVVVARSYSLLPVLLFSCVLLYPTAEKRLIPFLGLLALLACVSVHGLILSAALLTSLDLKVASRWKQQSPAAQRRILLATLAYVALVAIFAALAWPANDVAFPAQPEFSWNRIHGSFTMFLEQGFTGNQYLTLGILAASVPFLYRGGGLVMFTLSALALISFGGIIYSQVWHTGTLFLAWLGALWISAANTKVTRSALAALLVITGIQCGWTVKSSVYDWQNPYSGSKEVAAYLKTSGIASKPLLAFGYSCTAIQPYFKQNIFANYADRKAFWDWSTRNPVNEPGLLFWPDGPEYAILGYKAATDMNWLLSPLRQSGYSKVKHFSGSLFWRTSTFESEDFDLYCRTKSPQPVSLSYLTMADPASSHQLLAGFYSLEANSWRWTARDFTVLLKTPPSSSAGARMELHFYLSPVQIGKLGPITISATVNGVALKPETFATSGLYVYSSSVPTEALRHSSVFAKFSFDKFLRPWQADGRELGAVITAVGLQTIP